MRSGRDFVCAPCAALPMSRTVAVAVRRLFVLLVLLAATLPSASRAADRTFPLNHKRIRIEKLITQVAEETRRTILFDDQIRGNVSIVTKRPVTEAEAWSILDSALSMLGFSLLPSTVGNWRIAKMATAIGESPFVASAGTSSESFVTALIPLETADLQAVMNVLEPLSGTRTTLIPFEPTHSLIASGPERSIARLTTIADELDRIETLPIGLRVLRHRGVDDVEPLVEARFESGSSSFRKLQVWSDVRTNAILYRGSADEVARLSRFLDRIDRPVEGSGEIRILPVLNRDAEEVAELIRSLGQSSARGIVAADGRGRELAGADFTIAVDKATRSLVVRTDLATHRLIREVLETLDEAPQQIAVDITISELRTPRSFTLGFAFNVPLLPGDDASELVGRLISSPTPGGFLAQPTEQTRLFGRVARDAGVPFTIDGGDGITIPIEDTGVIDAGEFVAHTEVLIQPHLVVTAGESHEIFVGNNVPIPVTEDTGLAGGTTGTGGSALSQARNLLSRTIRFDRTDIGIRLGIEAKAGHAGKIQLDLDIEISSIAPSLAGDITKVGPTFIEQNLTVTARLDDGESAILAVNRQKKETRGRAGVPWLSEIPFLGWLFSRDVEIDEDVRLVIAARARRVSSPAQLVADSIRRRLAFQRQNAREGTFPTVEGASPFGVRVTTRSRKDDAEAIAEGLGLRGHRTTVHRWSLSGEDYFDVYVTSLDSMADAAEVANALLQEGWSADLVVLPTRS